MLMRPPLDAPRAPGAPIRSRLYESHYLTAVAPDGGRAVWLRYTSLKARGEPARGSVWCTIFDSDKSPIARRTASPRALSAPPPGSWAQIDAAAVGPGRAQGTLQECSWTITWDAHAQPLPYLPMPWLYDRRLTRSNGVALVPSASFAGHVDVGDERLELTGWRGMVGHNWGTDHAERWIWLHATGLGEHDPDGWLDLILARARLGPVLSPWLPAGALNLHGRLHRITAGAATRGLHVAVRRGTVTVAVTHLVDGGLTLTATVPANVAVHWDYASPNGRGRDVRHCSIASARVTIGNTQAFELQESLSIETGM